MKKSFINCDIALTGTLMAVCVFIFVTAGGFRGVSGRFPRIVSCVLFLLCAVQLGLEIRNSLSGAKSNPVKKPKEGNKKNYWVTVIGLLAYPALIFIAGYFPATFLYMLGSPFFYGYKRMVVAGLTSLIMCVFVYLMFVSVLRLQLPTGLFY